MPKFLAGCAKNGTSTLPAAPENPFYAWFGVDEAMLRRVMTELTSRGATHADIFFQHTRSNSIAMEDGIVSQAYSNIEQGVGLRVVVGDQVGYAFTEDITEEAMTAAARTAATIANGRAAVAPQRLSWTKDDSTYYRVQIPWSEVGVDKKLPKIQKAEALVRAGEASIKKVSIYWTDSEERVMVVNKDGRVVTDMRPMARMYVNLTAEKNGKQQSNGSNIAGRRGFEWLDDRQLQQVTREALDRTMVLFDAKRPPAGELPVILAAGASGILLHEAIGHGLEADFNRKKTSNYSDRIGELVASDLCTVVDDGTIDESRGSINVDDEGNLPAYNVLIEKGILQAYIQDRISAKAMGTQVSGNGRRQSFKHYPMPRMTNTYMLAGESAPDEIIAGVDKGIYCVAFSGGQVNISNGDFVFSVTEGYMIEDGKITAPIRNVNLIGNGPDVLTKVTAVGSDFELSDGRWTCGKDGQSVPVGVGIPTVLVSGMTVGGTKMG